MIRPSPFRVIALLPLQPFPTGRGCPKPPEGKAYDKLVVDTLRDVHNKGADLYNEAKDFVGAYRIYQGALLTVRPLLGFHQPGVQKAIDTGLAEAEKESNLALKSV